MDTQDGGAGAASRARFERIVGTLLSPSADVRDLDWAVQDWAAWAMGVLEMPESGFDAAGGELERATRLETGKAIGPLEAARCVGDRPRTVAFLRAVEQAIEDALARFPGETIHVVEAGCGPLAALALPFALRYPAGRVQFTLLDVHEVSLASVRRLAAELGVERSIRGYVRADAATHRFAPHERPHVIACEVLQRALNDEPQVAVTRNLALQRRAGGFFIPMRIEVWLGLFDAAAYFGRLKAGRASAAAEPTRGVRKLGRVFCLDAEAPEVSLADSGATGDVPVQVPVHHARKEPLHFFTRLDLHGGYRLEDFDCALNQPEPLAYPAALAERGGGARFTYRIGTHPGLAAEFAIASARDGGSMGAPS